MNQALLTAAAGMKARMESLDALGANIANASTSGFKADREFYRLFQTERARVDPRTGQAAWMPVVEASKIDFSQGPFEATGAPLDIALSGPGFLKFEAPGGGIFYSRAGSLTRSNGGELSNPQGLRALDDQDQPITLPPTGAIEIGPEGLIRVDGLTLARLAVVEFDNPDALAKAGSNLLAADAAEGRPAVATEVRQGFVEGSNVGVPEAAVRLIHASRHFDMLRRAATLIGDEMEGSAVERLGRT